MEIEPKYADALLTLTAATLFIIGWIYGYLMGMGRRIWEEREEEDDDSNPVIPIDWTSDRTRGDRSGPAR
jgi:hypothetical protein